MTNFETSITRLKLCLDDIKTADATKIKTTYKYAPMTLKTGEFPVGYLEPTTMGISAIDPSTMEKTIQVPAYVVTHAVEAQKYASSGYIAEIEQITQIADYVAAYFDDHLRLHTTVAPAQGNLAGLWRGIDYRIEIGVITARDGHVHVGLNMLFTLYFSKPITPHF